MAAIVLSGSLVKGSLDIWCEKKSFARDHNCTEENKYEIRLITAGIFFISGNRAYKRTAFYRLHYP